jgi:citrate synthase
MEKWIDRAQALARLGIKPQSLYAYVSRGQIGMQPDPADPRRSHYHAADIEALLARRKRGRKPSAIAQSTVAWGEPVLDTAITTVRHGQLIYRGWDAIGFAQHASLEEAAGLLWASEHRPSFAADGEADEPAFVALAGLAGSAPALLGRRPERWQADASEAIAVLARALGAIAGDAPVHQRIAASWRLSAPATDRVRQAMVLMADHEFNPSTFAVRVAASTGASIAASLLAGLATLSGPKHGGASAAVLALLRDVERDGVRPAVSAWLERHHRLPAFGHALYPAGDPRAIAMLDGLPLDEALVALRDEAYALTGEFPNLDYALAALIRADGLPLDAGFRLFALGRSIGWAAHAMEQAAAGQTIRPRANYIGN